MWNDIMDPNAVISDLRNRIEHLETMLRHSEPIMTESEYFYMCELAAGGWISENLGSLHSERVRGGQYSTNLNTIHSLIRKGWIAQRDMGEPWRITLLGMIKTDAQSYQPTGHFRGKDNKR